MLGSTVPAVVLALGFGTMLGGWVPPAAAQETALNADCPTTTEEENKAIVRRWYEEVFNQKNYDLVDDLYADEVVHGGAIDPDTPDPAAREAAVRKWGAGIPDIVDSVHVLVAAGDLVAVRWTNLGTHQGEFYGIAPTGNMVNFSGISIYRIECGKIAEDWIRSDLVTFSQQLEVPVGPGGSPASPAGDATQAPSPAATPSADCPMTTEEENLDLVRRHNDEVWNQGNVDGIDEFLAADFVHHGPVGPPSTGLAVREATVREFSAAFPDLELTIDELFAEGDLVVKRWTVTGTQEGEVYGIAPTGASVEFDGHAISRIECGKIAETWVEMGVLGMYQQLGVPSGVLAYLSGAAK